MFSLQSLFQPSGDQPRAIAAFFLSFSLYPAVIKTLIDKQRTNATQKTCFMVMLRRFGAEVKFRVIIYLSSRTYRRKTIEGFKDLVETLVYYRKNRTIVPDKAVANRLADIPAELQAKLANAGLITVTKSKTCQELWDTFMKHKTNVKHWTINLYHQRQMIFFRDVFASWGQAKESVWIGHSVKVMKDHYLCLSDLDFAEAAEADLESLIPPAQDHAKPTETDSKLE